MARILVDADACPVVAGVEEMAENTIFPVNYSVIRIMC